MILVTGGTGFLGAYIIKQLIEKGYAVRAIRRNNSQLPFFISSSILEKVQWVTGDVLDVVSLEEAMDGIDGVIHSAAIVSFQSSQKQVMFKTNVEGTANVVNTALEKNIRRLIHISSVAALGRTMHGERVNEQRQWQYTNTNTNYAISKYKAEIDVWRAMAEGLNGAIINPSTVLGYGNWNTSSCAIFKNVYEGFPYYTNGINGFVYVEDVARATVQLLESNITMERFIVSGDNWSYRQLLDTIADGFNKKHPYRNATPALAAIAWRVEQVKSWLSGKPSLLSRESARVAQSRTFFDNARILKTLPAFTFTPLGDAIEKICAAYSLNMNLGTVAKHSKSDTISNPELK